MLSKMSQTFLGFSSRFLGLYPKMENTCWISLLKGAQTSHRFWLIIKSGFISLTFFESMINTGFLLIDKSLIFLSISTLFRPLASKDGEMIWGLSDALNG